MQETLDDATEHWGIMVERVEMWVVVIANNAEIISKSIYIYLYIFFDERFCPESSKRSGSDLHSEINLTYIRTSQAAYSRFMSTQPFHKISSSFKVLSFRHSLLRFQNQKIRLSFAIALMSFPQSSCKTLQLWRLIAMA